MMDFKVSTQERKDIFADLKTEFIYIIIPFFLLIAVKIWMNSWVEILLTPDWSLASCIIFGQIASKVSKAVASSKGISQENFGLYTAKRVFLVIIAMTFYFAMLVKPSNIIGIMQVLYFVVAIYFHFADGYATALIQKRNGK